MIKHIVMWKLKEEAEGHSKKENITAVKSKLESLKAAIPQIVELEVGIQMEPAEAASDVVLFSTFKSKGDLDIYQKHPEHQKVAAFIRSVVSERKIVDYEV